MDAVVNFFDGIAFILLAQIVSKNNGYLKLFRKNQLIVKF
jgi:hypothetical protein